MRGGLTILNVLSPKNWPDSIGHFLKNRQHISGLPTKTDCQSATSWRLYMKPLRTPSPEHGVGARLISLQLIRAGEEEESPAHLF